MSRSTKTKNGKNLTAGFHLLEGRQLARRVTRQYGGGTVEDCTIPLSKKGTAAALMGGKRASTASPNEATTKMITQITRRITTEKPAGNSGSFRRKVPKTQKSPEDTVTDSKAEGGAVKRRRIEDGAKEAGIESEDAMKSQTVASVIEEEVVEPLEMSIDVDEPPPLDEEKKRRIEETQQLLKLISVDSVVAPVISQSAQSSSNRRVSLTQQAEMRRDAETREAVTQSRAEETIKNKDHDKETTKEITKEDKNREVEWHNNSGKDSDGAATLLGKFEEYFPSMDAGSEVFSDGNDIKNLLQIEERRALEQSSIDCSSHEEIEVEPNVEQMEVEEEVTVEGGEMLLVEACTSPNSEGIDEKTSCENNKSFKTVEITITESAESATTVVSSPGLCSVVEEETASNKRNDECADVGMPSPQPTAQSLTAAGENLVVQHSSNVVSDEVYQISEKSVGLTNKGSPSNFKLGSSSSKVQGSSRDLNGSENHPVCLENTYKENISLVRATETTIPAVDTSDSDNEKKSSAPGTSLDADVCHAVDQDTEASVEVRSESCSVSAVSKTSDITKTKSGVVLDTMHLDEEGPGTVKPTPSDNQISVEFEATSVAVSPTDDDRADAQVTGEMAEICAENLPGTSLLVEQDPENTDATVKSSSYEVRCNIGEREDGLHSSDTNPETDASNGEVADEGNTSNEGSSEKVAMSCATSVLSGPTPVLAVSATCGPMVSVVAARTFTSTVAGSGGPAVTSVVAAGTVPGFVGMPPVAIRAAMPGSAVGSVFVHVADPRQFAMHLQQQQGQVPAQAQTPVFHIPTLSPQQGGGPPQLVMSPLSPQQVALLSSSMPPTSQQPHQLMGGVPPRHVTLVTSGPRPQLLQQCLLTSAGPQPLALLPAAQPASTSTTTSGASSTAAAQPSVPVQHLAILSHALQGSGGTVTSTTTPTSGHQQPVALIAAGPNQAPVMRMAPAVLPRHPMSASSAMQHLTSAVQQTISLQQLQLSFAAAAAAAQQQQQLASSAVRSPIPIQRLPVLCTAQPSQTSATTAPSATTSLAVVSMAAAPVVSMPVSPMVSVAASALTAFLKKENMASQLLPPPATTIAKLSPHDVALKGGCSLLHFVFIV